MGIKSILLLIFFARSATLASNFLAIGNITLKTNSVETNETICLTYTYQDFIGDKSLCVYPNATAEKDTLEMASWMVYAFIRYNFNDEYLTGKTPLTGSNIKVLSTKLSDFTVDRSRILVYSDKDTEHVTEYVVYKFYRAENASNEFVFALFFDVQSGNVLMSPRGFLDISKIYGRQHNWYFILNSDEKIQQSKAIEYYEKLKDIKFKMFMNKNFRHESS